MGNNSLYVNFDGLERNIRELQEWKKDFDNLNSRINLKLEDLNTVWRGSDYDSLRNTVKSELTKISGPDGMIQNFVRDSINDLSKRLSGYADIQKNNANYWEKL